MIPKNKYQAPTPKKVTVQIYPLEKYTLRKKTLEKDVFKGSIIQYFYISNPVRIKGGIAHSVDEFLSCYIL